jgi:hypothetical protein
MPNTKHQASEKLPASRFKSNKVPSDAEEARFSSTKNGFDLATERKRSMKTYGKLKSVWGTYGVGIGVGNRATDAPAGRWLAALSL